MISAPAICSAVLIAAAPAGIARADEAALHLKDSPDAALVVSKCSICHSVDYIQSNAPFLKRAGWEAEVRKMVKVMGAPLDEAELARVVDYLTLQYGSDAP
ncbi:MAG: cytochrome c [Gammaproteobacteria bacterium]|nr:cytochrome c [Gammaproteobacteria bacterium]